jgi:hypothetical protein
VRVQEYGEGAAGVVAVVGAGNRWTPGDGDEAGVVMDVASSRSNAAALGKAEGSNNGQQRGATLPVRTARPPARLLLLRSTGRLDRGDFSPVLRPHSASSTVFGGVAVFPSLA